MIIEVLGFNSHMGGTEGIDNALYCFGNCLRRPPGISSEDTLRPVSDGDSGPLFEEPGGMALRPEARDLYIRGRLVALPTCPEIYLQKGIVRESPHAIQGFELLRVLVPDHRDLLLATNEELRVRVPDGLPCILRLDEWNHPDISGGDLPSETPTFRLLAEVLETGDPKLYRSRRKPNTHWSHWPEGGIL